MSPSIQTGIALIVVLIAALWLLRSALKRKQDGCGTGTCSAISPEVKRFQAHLKRH